MSKAGYVKAVSAICDDLFARSDAMPEPKTPQEVLATVRQMRDMVAEANTRVSGVTPPAADREQLEKEFFSGNRQQEEVLTAALPDLEAAVARGDSDEMQAFVGGPLAQVIALGEAQRKFLEAYGLTSCA